MTNMSPMLSQSWRTFWLWMKIYSKLKKNNNIKLEWFLLIGVHLQGKLLTLIWHFVMTFRMFVKARNLRRLMLIGTSAASNNFCHVEIPPPLADFLYFMFHLISSWKSCLMLHAFSQHVFDNVFEVWVIGFS